MRTNRGIMIGVLCEGTLLAEYGHQNEDEYTVSCFIPGEANKTFEIFVCNDLVMQDVSISIRIDGTFIGRYFLGQGQNVLPGLYVSACITKPFCFRELNVPDEQTTRDPQQWARESMGLLEFCVYRCIKKNREQFRSPYVPPEDTDNGPQASLQSISTGPERPIPPVEGVQGVTLDPPNQPFARMVFRYRSRAALQTQGVIPLRLPVPQTPSRMPPGQPPIIPQRNDDARRSLPPLADLQRAQRRTSATPVDSLPPRLRRSPYARAIGGPRVPSRAHSLPEPRLARPTSSAPAWAHASTADELASIKSQLASVYDQTQRSMQQIRSCVQTAEASMRQLHFLQQQVESLEMRQRQPQQVHPPPAPPLTRPQATKVEPRSPEAITQQHQTSSPRASPVLEWPS